MNNTRVRKKYFMNIINIEHIHQVFGEKTIFEDASYGISEGDKIGIIGINGTGKTTLLKMIAGVIEPDEGQIVRQNNIKIAYLAQNPDFANHQTVADYAFADVDEHDWTAISEIKSALNKLGITDLEMSLDVLSGGQKKKVALARVLTASFDVLLLDEPTNHLDSDMVEWLEDYLRKFKGVLVMVTHDRYFLDKVTNKILEISRGQIYGYEANYSKFLELKAEREEMELATERKRQSVLRMELEWAKRGCRARTTKQRARLERLEALKAGKAPETDAKAQIGSAKTRMGKKTIELHHVSKAFGTQVIVDDFDYIFLKNQCVAFVGPNGCGKSTLLKMIAGIVPTDSGEVEIGETIHIGYFSQEIPDMDTNQRVIDYIKDVAEYIETGDGRISASMMLERFLFTPEMQYSPISKLSGGEKKRLYLLKVLSASPNVLILDEVSNDIDIPTMTILEDYLTDFAGIIITVSHDRYFLDNVADRIFEFSGNGKLTQYEGSYTDYINTKASRGVETVQNADKAKTAKTNDTEKDGASDSKQTWKQNRPVKLKFSYKEQKEFETIDEDIEKLETKIAELEQAILDNATNSFKLMELSKEKEDKEAELEEKMDRWVYLNDLAERIEAQKNQ